jgi:hypothetical protein
MFKNGCVCREGAYESREDKTFKEGEGIGTEGGWRSNCMSRRRRDKERGRLAGGSWDRREILGPFGLVVSTEIRTVPFDQGRH